MVASTACLAAPFGLSDLLELQLKLELKVGVHILRRAAARRLVRGAALLVLLALPDLSARVQLDVVVQQFRHGQPLSSAPRLASGVGNGRLLVRQPSPGGGPIIIALGPGQRQPVGGGPVEGVDHNDGGTLVRVAQQRTGDRIDGAGVAEAALAFLGVFAMGARLLEELSVAGLVFRRESNLDHVRVAIVATCPAPNVPF